MKKLVVVLLLLTVFQAKAQQPLTAKSESSTVNLKPLHKSKALPLQVNLDTVDLEKLSYSGRNYALLIGIASYNDRRLLLRRITEDLRRLSESLVKNYNFEASDVITLNSPRRYDIVDALAGLKNILQPDDNLMIVYAGQGSYDSLAHEAYWLPVDANRGNRGNYMSNTEIRNILANMDFRHALVVSETGFGENIVNTDNVKPDGMSANIAADLKKAALPVKWAYLKKSCQVLSTGNLTEIPDNGSFLKLLTDKLNENPKFTLSVSDLYKNLLTVSADSTLKLGVIRDSGDATGEFVLIKKKVAVIAPATVTPKKKKK